MRCIRFLCLALACLLAGGEAAAQVTTGSIGGGVADNSGAVLPGVQVTLQG